MDIAALETYVRDLDVSNCSKPELRRLLAAASSIAARGRAEIEARPCTFPARLAPLVTQWLPLSDVGAALSCSGQWRDTSEWAFQLVAARIGLAHERGVSWRENVKHRLRWIGEAREPGSVEVELARALSWTTGGALTCTAPGYGSGDTYFVGSGFRMPEQGARTVEWRVHMTRDDTTNPIDACGFALLDSTRRQILLSYHWNSDGQLYEGDQYQTPWMRERRVHDADDEDNPDIFGTDATLQITVDPTWHQNRRGGSDQVVNTLVIFGYLYLVESDGSLTGLSAFNHNVERYYYSDQLDDFFRRCGQQNQWDGENVCDLCVVPFVRLFEDSTATLSRVPAGPEAAGSNESRRVSVIRHW